MELVSNAIAFATRAHDGMRRKGTTVPYILHPLEAAVIVGSMTDDAEIIAAALLHDVLEDTEVTAEQIEKEFGSRILELVLSETEDKRAELPPEQTWQIRKEEAILFLRNSKDIAVKMLYIGDKLSNIRSLYRDVQIQGEEIWQRFNQKDPAKHKWYYSEIAEATKDLQHTQAWQEFNSLVLKVFE